MSLRHAKTGETESRPEKSKVDSHEHMAKRFSKSPVRGATRPTKVP